MALERRWQGRQGRSRGRVSLVPSITDGNVRKNAKSLSGTSTPRKNKRWSWRNQSSTDTGRMSGLHSRRSKAESLRSLGVIPFSVSWQGAEVGAGRRGAAPYFEAARSNPPVQKVTVEAARAQRWALACTNWSPLGDSMAPSPHCPAACPWLGIPANSSS